MKEHLRKVAEYGYEVQNQMFMGTISCDKWLVEIRKTTSRVPAENRAEYAGEGYKLYKHIIGSRANFEVGKVYKSAEGCYYYIDSEQYLYLLRIGCKGSNMKVVISAYKLGLITGQCRPIADIKTFATLKEAMNWLKSRPVINTSYEQSKE